MSKEKRYTPGGWFLSSTGNDVLEVSGGVIAKLLVPDGCAAQRMYREDQMEANAHLIAAAPELLEALEEAIRAWRDAYAAVPDKWKSAVAKAYGEDQS